MLISLAVIVIVVGVGIYLQEANNVAPPNVIVCCSTASVYSDTSPVRVMNQECFAALKPRIGSSVGKVGIYMPNTFHCA